MTETLADALPKEMARVRDEVLPEFQACGPAGGFAVAVMRRDLDLAAKAMVEGDVQGMIVALQELRSWKL